MKTLEFIIQRDPVSDYTKLFLVDRSKQDLLEYTYNSNDKLFTQRVVENGGTVNPLIELNNWMFDALCKTILEYAKINNIRLDEGELKGKLDAQTKHLEDLRKYLDKFIEKM